jgi:hypothetical protein
MQTVARAAAAANQDGKKPAPRAASDRFEAQSDLSEWICADDDGE